MAETRKEGPVTDQIEVLSPGCRERFKKWIAERGGVRLWNNANLSDPDAGMMFTPAKTEKTAECEPEDYPKPHWSRTEGELVTDINRFKFVVKMHEVKRFHVATRMGGNGMSIKVTDGGSRRIDSACNKATETYGRPASYEFDYEDEDEENAVILVPIWEGEKMVDGRIVNE